jgi:hypothetical protein
MKTLLAAQLTERLVMRSQADSALSPWMIICNLLFRALLPFALSVPFACGDDGPCGKRRTEWPHCAIGSMYEAKSCQCVAVVDGGPSPDAAPK